MSEGQVWSILLPVLTCSGTFIVPFHPKARRFHCFLFLYDVLSLIPACSRFYPQEFDLKMHFLRAVSTYLVLPSLTDGHRLETGISRSRRGETQQRSKTRQRQQVGLTLTARWHIWGQSWPLGGGGTSQA